MYSIESYFLTVLLKGFELGRINGSTPQNIATVASLIYLRKKFIKGLIFYGKLFKILVSK
jgi:hypothetical protein